MLKRIDKFMNRICFGFSFLGATIVFGLMFLICSDVFGRAFFHHPVMGTTEIAQNMTAVVIFMMLPWATYLGQHVRSTMFLSRMPRKAADFMEVLAYFIGCVLFIGVIISSWPPMVVATRIRDFQGEVFSFPLYPVWWVLIIGSALSLYQCVRHLVIAVRAFRGKEPELVATIDKGVL